MAPTGSVNMTLRTLQTAALSLLALLCLPTVAVASATQITPARAIMTQPPVYPTPAQSLGIEGLVLLQLQLSSSGEVIEVTVRQDGGHPLLQAAAIRSVRDWQFAPATLEGQPVASSLLVPIRFELLAQRKGRDSLGPASLKALW